MYKSADILHALSSVSIVHDRINFSDRLVSLFPWHGQMIKFTQVVPKNYQSLDCINEEKRWTKDINWQSSDAKSTNLSHTSTSNFINFEQFARSSGKLMITLFDACVKSAIAYFLNNWKWHWQSEARINMTESLVPLLLFHQIWIWCWYNTSVYNIFRNRSLFRMHIDLGRTHQKLGNIGVSNFTNHTNMPAQTVAQSTQV